MSGWLSLGASIGAVFLAAAAVRAQAPGELKPGDPAPAFALEGSDGKTYRLADFKGKKVVVLAWFPKAFTGG
jgi:thioredoxin-dependent peroxiredoxin